MKKQDMQLKNTLYIEERDSLCGLQMDGKITR